MFGKRRPSTGRDSSTASVHTEAKTRRSSSARRSLERLRRKISRDSAAGGNGFRWGRRRGSRSSLPEVEAEIDAESPIAVEGHGRQVTWPDDEEDDVVEEEHHDYKTSDFDPSQSSPQNETAGKEDDKDQLHSAAPNEPASTGREDLPSAPSPGAAQPPARGPVRVVAPTDCWPPHPRHRVTAWQDEVTPAGVSPAPSLMDLKQTRGDGPSSDPSSSADTSDLPSSVPCEEPPIAKRSGEGFAALVYDGTDEGEQGDDGFGEYVEIDPESLSMSEEDVEDEKGSPKEETGQYWTDDHVPSTEGGEGERKQGDNGQKGESMPAISERATRLLEMSAAGIAAGTVAGLAVGAMVPFMV